MHVSLCPPCHRPAAALSSDSLCSSHSISAYFAASEGASPVAVTSPLLQLPPRGVGPISFPLFLPFLSFVLPSYVGNFSCPFRCPRSSASVQQVFCVNCSTCRCILDVLVGRSEPQVLLFHHLDLDSPYFVIFKHCK